MIIFDGRTYLKCRITIPKRDDIDQVYFKIYNCLSLNSKGDKICVVNVIFFYFKDAGKPEIFYIQKYVLWLKKKPSVPFI